MTTVAMSPFEQFLKQQDEDAWAGAVTTLLRSTHEVDKNALQIWFAFYPLSLFLVLETAADREALEKKLLLQGDFYLKNQIDSSHRFLYGHRYWPEVKKAIERRLDSFQPAPDQKLADAIIEAAQEVAKTTKTTPDLLVAITAAGFMTLRQSGAEDFRKAPGEVLINRKTANRSPAQVLKERAKDDSQGLFGFLRTVNKKWTVTYDENDPSATYRMNHLQDLAWGAADDRTRDWRAIDPRRIEGPIPVECRSASCGTCWVGVLGGGEKLTDVAAREGKQVRKFGYIDSNEAKPLIRLACQAQTTGAVSVVIPPWNGVYGKYLRSLNEKEAGE